MAERLPELRPLKGRTRVLRFHGSDGLGRRPYRTFLTDYYVTSDPVDLASEGRDHAGHEHLTFSNCVANTGDGALVLEMTRTSRNRAEVAQLIEDDAKPRHRWRRQSAGTAVRDTNPDHNHWHYADFLQYKLKSGRTGRYVGRAMKQSFCLEDVAKLRANAGRRGFTKCPNPRANKGIMGISVGWGDVYWAGLQEQFIEVKGLPRGPYWLECVVDPRRRLKLKTRGHLSTRVKIHIK